MAPQHSEGTERPEATEDIRARMRRGLVDAMKARDQQAVSALRSTLARIDNAEAVDADGLDADGLDADGLDAEPALYRGVRRPAVAGSVLGVGAAEVDRRVLTPDEVAAVVGDDVEEREMAAEVLERVGRPDHAERLRAQAKLLTTYLTTPGSPPETPHGG
jgi:uncharacterized protein YqeY